MRSFLRRLRGVERKDPGERKGQYGVDYVGASELMRFNRNLLEARKHENIGIEFYTRFLEEANDERGQEMYRKLLVAARPRAEKAWGEMRAKSSFLPLLERGDAGEPFPFQEFEERPAAGRYVGHPRKQARLVQRRVGVPAADAGDGVD